MKPLPLVKNCDGCGACCTEQAALPVSWYAAPESTRLGDPSTLPPDLLAELVKLRDRFLATQFPPDGSPCVWYDPATRRCRHYEHRPELCRDEVKPGDEACLRWRRLKGVDPQTRYTIKNGRIRKVI
jgi:uncharacterized protein